MGARDVSQLSYEEIYNLCKWYSRGSEKYEKNSRDIKSKIFRLGGTRI